MLIKKTAIQRVDRYNAEVLAAMEGSRFVYQLKLTFFDYCCADFGVVRRSRSLLAKHITLLIFMQTQQMLTTAMNDLKTCVLLSATEKELIGMTSRHTANAVFNGSFHLIAAIVRLGLDQSDDSIVRTEILQYSHGIFRSEFRGASRNTLKHFKFVILP